MKTCRWVFILVGVSGVFLGPGIAEPDQRMSVLTLLTNNDQIVAATVCHDTPFHRGAEACSGTMGGQRGWPEFSSIPHGNERAGGCWAANVQKPPYLASRH